MLSSQIAYRSGYKYVLAADYSTRLPELPGYLVNSSYVYLDLDGTLTIREGYAWDGPSGPAIDTSNFMRGSLVHDALYQLMNEGRLPAECRAEADKALRRICREDGMSALRSSWVYFGVSKFGGPHAKLGNTRPVHLAPK